MNGEGGAAVKIGRASKSGLFLVELIIAILFFAVASVICVQLFVKAHLVSRQSRDVTAAITLAQNYAEQFKAMGDSDKLALQTHANTVRFYYGYEDNELVMLAAADREQALYALTAQLGFEETLYCADITVRRAKEESEEPLFTLQVKDYAGSPAEVTPLLQ